MSIKQGEDFVYLMWQDEKSRRNYIVGELCKNDQYEFKYGFDILKAQERGFKLLIPFDNIEKTYTNTILFPSFSSRLPEKNRKGIEEILKKYGLDEYDEFKLLKRSNAKLPVDNLRFIDPIFSEIDDNVERVFHIAGPRYYMDCKGEDCILSYHITQGEKLCLEHDPNNKMDSNAIKITKDGKLVGFVPRYYCESILALLNKGYNYECIVIEAEKENCSECIKVRLRLNKI